MDFQAIVNCRTKEIFGYEALEAARKYNFSIIDGALPDFQCLQYV